MIFDCWAKHPANGKQGLAGGIIVPEELAGKYVTVFVSHAHGDHFNPMIFRWADKIQDIRYVLSDDIPSRAGALMAAPHRSYDLGDMTVETFRSTDEGVAAHKSGRAFHLSRGRPQLVALEREDPWWNEDMARDYKKEIGLLADKQIDIAFIPVDPRLGDSMLLGIEYFMEHVGAKMVVPMHYGSAGAEGGACAARIKGAGTLSRTHRDAAYTRAKHCF